MVKKVPATPQLGRSTRILRSSTLARPYIWRLRNFKRLTCPSVWPLLHGSVKAARTAAKSWCRLLAKLRISGALQRDKRPQPSVELSGTPPMHGPEELPGEAAHLRDDGPDPTQGLHETLVIRMFGHPSLSGRTTASTVRNL